MQVFVFPGQGSQRKGMGQDLFDKVPEFLAIEQDVDALLGYSVRKLCLEDENKQLSQTQYTQPCLFVVNALHYYATTAAGKQPSYLAGHSLGEYNALMAAGAFDLITGLRLVQKRGELMAMAKDGGMAAVIGLAPEKVTRLLAEHRLSALDVANYNSPSQTVISGLVAEIQRAGAIFEKAGANMYVQLPVSAAFHSRYMADAAHTFDDFLSTFKFGDLTVPVISNVTGQPYPSDNARLSVRSLLVKQIVRPVLWTHSVRFLLSKGASSFIEIGPGEVVTRLIGQIKTATSSVSLAKA